MSGVLGRNWRHLLDCLLRHVNSEHPCLCIPSFIGLAHDVNNIATVNAQGGYFRVTDDGSITCVEIEHRFKCLEPRDVSTADVLYDTELGRGVDRRQDKYEYLGWRVISRRTGRSLATAGARGTRPWPHHPVGSYGSPGFDGEASGKEMESSYAAKKWRVAPGQLI